MYTETLNKISVYVMSKIISMDPCVWINNSISRSLSTNMITKNTLECNIYIVLSIKIYTTQTNKSPVTDPIRIRIAVERREHALLDGCGVMAAVVWSTNNRHG